MPRVLESRLRKQVPVIFRKLWVSADRARLFTLLYQTSPSHKYTSCTEGIFGKVWVSLIASQILLLPYYGTQHSLGTRSHCCSLTYSQFDLPSFDYHHDCCGVLLWRWCGFLPPCLSTSLSLTFSLWPFLAGLATDIDLNCMSYHHFRISPALLIAY